jgi:glycosyltransferase involved in cell wall biosynthesis
LLRIAIYHNLPSGGGKRALFEMARRLADKHEIDVYTLSSAERDLWSLQPFSRRYIVFPFRPLPLARCPLGRLNQGIRTLDLLRLRALERRIARRIDGEGYDIAFVHNCQYGQSPGLLSFLRTPSVYYCQEPPRWVYEPGVPRPYTTFSAFQRMGNRLDPLPHIYRRVLTHFDRRNVSAAGLVLVNSAYSRESLYRTYGLFAQVCYLGVDTELFRPLSLPRADFVLSVGALTPRKGFDFLLHSLALIPNDRRPRLVIVSNFSDGNEHAYLQSLAGRLGVAVEFHVRIADDELVRLYNQALLTAYSPIMEPFGFVPIESMACGTPVVGVREGGIRESVVDGETGILTDRDPECFAQAMETLLNDPARRAHLGQQGRRHAEKRWQWARSVSDLERYFARMEQPSPRRPGS